MYDIAFAVRVCRRVSYRLIVQKVEGLCTWSRIHDSGTAGINSKCLRACKTTAGREVILYYDVAKCCTIVLESCGRFLVL